MDYRKEYERWCACATSDADVAAELKTMDDAKVEDAFYRDLSFGTGGLRGVIGAGTNRMNIYTVAKASQGLADYLNKHFDKDQVGCLRQSCRWRLCCQQRPGQHLARPDACAHRFLCHPLPGHFSGRHGDRLP